MNKFKKLFLLPMMLTLFSCSDTTLNLSSSEQVSEQVSNLISNEVVNIYNESLYTSSNSIEQAINKVYDSVVVIEALLSNGTSSGSGVIFAESENYSYIMTCHHVIEDAYSFDVILNDNQSFEAILVGGDYQSDIAVLAINKIGLTIAPLIDDSDSINVGSTAIVIGNPLGTLGGSVTSGIISSKSRNITMSDGTIMNLIQTDAAINSGNSGGGLFNIAGQLVGIVNAKYSATGIEGLGFAIPINTAREIATELIQYGQITGRYKLGLSFADGYYRTMGGMEAVIYVSSVESNTSGYMLQYEDIINSISIDYYDDSKTDINDKTFENSSELVKYIANADLAINDTITFEIRRNYTTQMDIEVLITQYVYKIPN